MALDSNSPAQPNIDLNLIPEHHCLAGLTPHWKRVMAQAIGKIQKQLHAPLNWQAIADEYGVSASHFHQKFTRVFAMTPGQYQRRCRLHLALYYLWAEPEFKVGDIAVEIGLSSSQALAKLLRQQLGTSARAIRTFAREQDHRALANLTQQLTQQPTQQLTQSPSRAASTSQASFPPAVAFVLRRYPKRYFHTQNITAHSWSQVKQEWKKRAPSPQTEMVICGRWGTLEQQAAAGFETKGEVDPQTNLVAPAGQYLECRVLLNSLGGYYDLWDALEAHVKTHKMTISQQAIVLECYQSIPLEDGAYPLTLSILVDVE